MAAEERGPIQVLALTPRGRDADLTCTFLARAGIGCTPCHNLDELVRAMRDEEVGAVMVVEEALAGEWERFAATIANQPPWSDLPVILFTMRHGPTVTRVLSELGGNVTVLERPLRSATVVSAVKSALRARMRQLEVRDLLQRQEELLEILASNDRRKDEFLALLGHELRNPLAAIQNAVYLFHERQEQPIDPRTLQILDRQLKNLRRLVDDLLDVSRVTLGKIQLERVPIELGDLVSRGVQALARDAAARQQTLATALPEHPVYIVGDQVRLKQALTNLVTNSIKFTPRGGSIGVDLAVDGDHAIVTVRDNGMGISSSLLPNIFELFSQGAQALDRARGGLGLGLSLARSLVERHGGVLSASSDGEDRGSCFALRLPLGAVPSASAEVASAAVTPALRILVVEDNEDARDSLIALLETWGHEAEGVADGRAGLERLISSLPHVALVDIGLPELDGYEVARQARAGLGAVRPRLVAMTGYGQPEDRQRALDAGFDVHLVKPVSPDELGRILRSSARAAAG